MKYNTLCYICGKGFKDGEDVELKQGSLIHTACMRLSDIGEELRERRLREVISNFDEMKKFTTINIDLAELVAYTKEISKHKFFVTFTGSHGGFACLYTDKEDLAEAVEFIEEQRNVVDENMFITSIIKNGKFVKWEEIPMSIKVLEE